MLEYRRYRDAAAHLGGLFADGRRYLYRSAPLPPWLRRASLDAASQAYEARQLAEALGGLLRVPPPPDTSHIRPTVSLERRLQILQALLSARGSFEFDDVFADEDRLTQAVTLFALLEMHKRGEASWEQRELFGPIRISAAHGN
jgi:segregation and condensation protein A